MSTIAFATPSQWAAMIRRTSTAGGPKVVPGTNGEYFALVAIKDTSEVFSTPTGGGGGGTGGTLASATRPAGAPDSLYLNNPVTIPPNRSRLVLTWDLTVPTGASVDEILEFTSTTFRIRIDARATKHQVEITAEDNGTPVIGPLSGIPSGITDGNDFTPGTPFTLKAVVKLKVGAVDGFGKIFINGSESFNRPISTTNTGTFASNRNLEVFRGSLAVTSRDLKIWADNLSDDSTPTGTPLFTLQGDAATLNARSDKVGVGSFT